MAKVYKSPASKRTRKPAKRAVNPSSRLVLHVAARAGLSQERAARAVAAVSSFARKHGIERLMELLGLPVVKPAPRRRGGGGAAGGGTFNRRQGAREMAGLPGDPIPPGDDEDVDEESDELGNAFSGDVIPPEED
jgi:hypothetical protein